MENAISFKNISSLDGIHLDNISRFHFGEEFCERLLPSVVSLKKAIKKARLLNKKFSLLTPPTTESGLNDIKSLINLLDCKDEIIINDYGVLNLINNEFKNPIVIGRILGRNILRILKGISKDKKLVEEYLSLLGPRINFIELDYFNANAINDFLSKIIKFSFYRGPFFWTMTRRCAFNTNSKPLDKFADCEKDCLRHRAVIHNKVVGKDFLLEGNKIISLEKIPKKKIDYRLFKRIVYKLREKDGITN